MAKVGGVGSPSIRPCEGMSKLGRKRRIPPGLKPPRADLPPPRDAKGTEARGFRGDALSDKWLVLSTRRNLKGIRDAPCAQGEAATDWRA